MPVFADRPELLSCFRRGDAHALECVYRAYMQPVEAYLHRLLRYSPRARACGRDSIADIVQDVFMRAFEPRARVAYDPTRPYGPYLRAIARHHFLDFLRGRKREFLWPDNEFPDVLECDADIEPRQDPDVVAIVHRYLADLSGATKRVYEERFVFGKSQQAAGDCIGMSRHQVRTSELHLKRGLRKALVHGGFRAATLARES
jgi:RNA polymerase sigma factor (sigma-70 family)